MDYSCIVQEIESVKQLFLLPFAHLVVPLTKLHLELNASAAAIHAFFAGYSRIHHDIEAAQLCVWAALQSRSDFH